MANEDPDAILETLKKAGAALRDGGVEYMLAGGMAAWARGGPESDHDLDLALRRDDAEKALEVLEENGFKPERPPEGWLVKAHDDNDVLVDLIYEPAGEPVDDAMFERATELSVNSVFMLVMSADDIVASKLLSMNDHYMDYEGILLMARSLREQLHWDDLRKRTDASPFARAFFTLAEGLELYAPGEPQG